MADLVVERGADALGKALIVERSRYAAMLDRIIVHQRVDIFRGHARMDAFSDQIQDTVVDGGGLSDQTQIFRALDQRTRRHRMPFQLQDVVTVIPFLMALLILLPAAAPAA